MKKKSQKQYVIEALFSIDLPSPYVLAHLNDIFPSLNCSSDIIIYQSPLIFTELFQHNLINVSYLTACYLYQVMMTLHF